MSKPKTSDNNKKPITSYLEDATPLLSNPVQLRKQAEELGYLYFRGFLASEKVLDVRRSILQILDEQKLLHDEKDYMDGVANLTEVHRYSKEEIASNGVGVPDEIYRKVQKLENFHALAHSPDLLNLYKLLFDADPFVHPRSIGRIMLPHRELAPTPSHQDYLHIQGAEQTWTCWVPLGDIPQSLGGLAMLKGSHKSGLLGVTNAPGAGGLETILCGLDYEWQGCDFTTGDILTFHSHTVHKSLPNQHLDLIRLSCDFRYQPIHEPIEQASLLPHGSFTWEDLYEGWREPHLQYYWKDSTFEMKTFDDSIRWQKDKIC